MPRVLRLALLGLALIILVVPASLARMGGGHTYSSGGAGSSSHSRGGGGSHFSFPSTHGYSGHPGYVITPSASKPPADVDRFPLLVEMVVLIIVVYILFRLLRQGSLAGAVQTHHYTSRGTRVGGNQTLDQALRNLKDRDENFSGVLFLDFACLLYHKFYAFRGTDQFRVLSAYLSPSLFDQTTAHELYRRQRIHDIVVGKARMANIFLSERSDGIIVEFASNLTLRYLSTGESARFATEERWTFIRAKGVVSPSPSQMRTLSCPNCGAPADFTDAGECQYCHSFIQGGEKQWQVEKISILSRQPFEAETPGGYQQEAGTDLPTIRQPGLESLQQEYMNNHGLEDWTEFFGHFTEKVVEPYFQAAYAAWSQGDWHQARHLLSDRLYESNGFWMQEYQSKGWRNRLENIDLRSVVLARIDLDRFYESLTVRVFASCLDYTVDRQGRVIGGSDRVPRSFSEYWTFVRSANPSQIKPDYDIRTCPSCGAPADKVGQAGICEYCGSKITEGDFSWVLTVITQDEAYEG